VPELPEVETVRQTLKNLIIGKKITGVMFFYNGIVKNETPDDFRRKIVGQVFHDIRRKGKYLMFDLTDYTLVSHLRMEGKYFLRKTEAEFTKHEHVVFVLDDKVYLTYHDVRKFGTMELVTRFHEQELDSVNILGKEINDPELDVEYLYPQVKKAARPIKSVLLDQNIVSGLGNIYVDETLFLAKINPRKAGNTLDVYQVEKIIKLAKKVIDRAIVMGGTTIRTYQSSFGVDGRFQNELNVHTLEGETCKACGDKILKTRVGGRGTYYCPTCQREDGMKIIGLTGGIASGKSLVADLFIKNDVLVLDADKIYKNLLKTNKIMYNEIVKIFGSDIEKDDSIDFKKLGDMIFKDGEKRLLLNSVTHPYVIDEIEERLSNARSVGLKMVVLDVPLLFEANLEHMCDLVILAYCDWETQIQRLMNRDSISREVAFEKMASQMSLEDKRIRADIIIDNSGTREDTQEQFYEILNNLRSD